MIPEELQPRNNMVGRRTEARMDLYQGQRFHEFS
jgi:hypothetical protein